MDKNIDLNESENKKIEKAILVGIEVLDKKIPTYDMISLDELEELAKTAGAEVVHKVYQKRNKIDATFYAGSGLIEEIKILVEDLEADVVIFDNELSGSQTRNIEESVGAKIIDRTMLILDIFASRAISKEGKLQVELAQLKYRLPRLIGLGNQLSRLGGGIGTRGPGEKKLESDRRHIRRRITNIEAELDNVKKRRSSTRLSRRKRNVFVIALVGYTNAGKSTLLNRLCETDVFTEDKLFATLDPTTRKLEIGNKNLVLIDTVGFIRRLPHDLIDAFKSTLEEVKYADAYIHVIDSVNPDCNNQIGVVNNLLQDLEAYDKPNIIALNKIDEKNNYVEVKDEYLGKMYKISAKNNIGIEELRSAIIKIVEESKSEVKLIIPYGEEKNISILHEFTNITEIKYTENGVEISTILNEEYKRKFKKYIFYYK